MFRVIRTLVRQELDEDSEKQLAAAGKWNQPDTSNSLPHRGRHSGLREMDVVNTRTLSDINLLHFRSK